jgi:HIV Tat-specific factor 1
MSSNEDFELQLRLEAEEAKRKRDPLPEADNPYLTRDPSDGTLYEWDAERKAWFPKIDDNFIAMYQASYGVNATESNKSVGSDDGKQPEPTDKNEEDAKEGDSTIDTSKPSKSSVDRKRPIESTDPTGSDGKRGKKEAPAEWFEMQDEHNRNVYVSNLPTDLDEEEFVQFMSKCGMVMKDANTNRFRVKLYRDTEGQLKGDALCTYIKVESVQLAEQILDGYVFKGKEVKVEKAKFVLKGEYDPSKRPRKPKAKDKQKIKKKLEKYGLF